MNYERLCCGCFREKPDDSAVCPYCGYGPHVEHPANTLPPGTILNGRYLVGKVLGVGGFGATYLAFDMKLEEKCACKEYLPSGMAVRTRDRYTLSVARSENRGVYQNGMEKFLDEARILARLKDIPNIVSVRDYFRENGTAYFVMQYIEGKSLKDLLRARGGRLPYEETARVLLPVMRAMQQVHAKQLLHRDISPDNIILTKKGESVLLDFGAARSSAGDHATMSVILKHGYAPVEQYSSHGNQGPWTDVYAMGATMYHCLTGKLPPNAVDRLSSDALVRPGFLGVQLPAAAENALMTALAVRPEDRYANMQAFADALQAGAPVRAQQPAGYGAGTPAAAAQPATHSGRQASPGTPLPRTTRSKRLLPVILAAAVAAVVIIVALAVHSSRSRADDPAISATDATAAQAETGTGGDVAQPTETPQSGAPQSAPTEEPSSSFDPEDYAVYEEAAAGLTFHYIPDDVIYYISDGEADELPYRSVFFTYTDVDIMISRAGSSLGTAQEVLDLVSAPGEGESYYGETGQIAQLGDLQYYYTVLQEDESLYAYYATEIDGEVVLITEYLWNGSQTEAQANQFAMIASTIELL